MTFDEATQAPQRHGIILGQHPTTYKMNNNNNDQSSREESRGEERRAGQVQVKSRSHEGEDLLLPVLPKHPSIRDLDKEGGRVGQSGGGSGSGVAAVGR
jgi:hypothetical protein